MPDTAIVVNTSPTLGLIAALGELSALQKLYAQIVIPHAVQLEVLAAGAQGFGVDAFNQAHFLYCVAQPIELPTLLRASLDRGEAEVIACAQDMKISLVCIDEIQGRRIARLSGLRVTGSVGVLLRLKAQGHLDNIKPCLVRMRQQGIWLSKELEQHALVMAGEA